MKWIFGTVVILLIWLLVIKDNAELPVKETSSDENVRMILEPLQPKVSAKIDAVGIAPGLVVGKAVPLAQSEAVELSSALCLEGRGCILDLHENWHLKLLNEDGGLLSPALEAVFKSRNFIEAAEQLHYSRQKADDHKTEMKLEQLMLIAVQKFKSEPQALGCRDHICLLQMTVPRDIKVDDVRKSLMDSDLSLRTLHMSKQKSKYNWSLRFVATVDNKVVLSNP